MELKNAAAVCLIAFFAATLVLLMARALDVQSSARVEMQLARIADHLEAIRQQGGISSVPRVTPGRPAIDDGLVAYYFHGNMRCATCRSIEEQSHAAIRSQFPNELSNGDVVWRILNYEEGDGAELAKTFEIQVPVVVLARMQNGQIGDWRRFDKVWALVGDKTSFAEFVCGELTQMLQTNDAVTEEASQEQPLDIPLPTENVPEILAPEILVPEILVPDDPGSIPIPD